MDEALEKRILIILGVLTVIFFLGTLKSCSTASRMKAARDKEMVQRLDTEEKMNKFTQEKNVLEEKTKAAEKALQEEQAANQATRKALVQEQLVGQSLKEELAKVTKLKEALEEDLKEALTNKKKAQKK